jgi:hypothetical protein
MVARQPGGVVVVIPVPGPARNAGRGVRTMYGSCTQLATIRTPHHQGFRWSAARSSACRPSTARSAATATARHRLPIVKAHSRLRGPSPGAATRHTVCHGGQHHLKDVRAPAEIAFFLDNTWPRLGPPDTRVPGHPDTRSTPGATLVKRDDQRRERVPVAGAFYWTSILPLHPDDAVKCRVPPRSPVATFSAFGMLSPIAAPQ